MMHAEHIPILQIALPPGGNGVGLLSRWDLPAWARMSRVSSSRGGVVPCQQETFRDSRDDAHTSSRSTRNLTTPSQQGFVMARMVLSDFLLCATSRPTR